MQFAELVEFAEYIQRTRRGAQCSVSAISVADRSIVVTRRVLRAMESIAEDADIPYQYKLPSYGGTDAGAIHLTRGGVLAGIVSVPCRYIHSPISTLRLSDLELTSRFVTELVKGLPEAVL